MPHYGFFSAFFIPVGPSESPFLGTGGGFLRRMVSLTNLTNSTTTHVAPGKAVPKLRNFRSILTLLQQ